MKGESLNKEKKKFHDNTKNKNLKRSNFSKQTIRYVKTLIYCQCLRGINEHKNYIIPILCRIVK